MPRATRNMVVHVNHQNCTGVYFYARIVPGKLPMGGVGDGGRSVRL